MKLELGRRSLLKTLFGAAAAPVAAPLMKAAAPAAVTANGTAGVASVGIPMIDIVRRVVGGGSSSANLQQITPEIFTYVSGWKLKRIVHTASLFYEKEMAEVMLADPVGRKLYLDWWIDERSYEISPFRLDWGAEHEKICGALIADGRTSDARALRNFVRVQKVYMNFYKKWQRADRYAVPPHIVERLKSTHYTYDHAGVKQTIEETLKITRAIRHNDKLVAAYHARPEKGKSWTDAFYKEYYSTRSMMMSNSKYREIRWLRKIQKIQRQRAKWTASYRLKRRPFFLRELALWEKAKKTIVEAIVEHSADPNGQEKIDVCLRLLQRMEVLMRPTREALLTPPKFDPLEVTEKVLSQRILAWFTDQDQWATVGSAQALVDWDV
jgi:hypothetical protein